MTGSPIIPPGFALMAACARWPRSPERLQAVEAAAARVADWPQFLAVVARHRIRGLAYDALKAPSLGGAQPPAYVLEQLSVQARSQTLHGLLLAAEAVRLDDAFAAAGVPLAFLKGPAAALEIYGDLGLRHARDLDLVVAPADIAAAAQLLEDAGYRGELPLTARELAQDGAWRVRTNQLNYVHPGRRVLVELHWRVTSNAALSAPFARQAAWRRTPLGGGSISALSGDDLFAYLCLHGGLHAWSRFKWLADIGAMIASDDEQALRRRLDRAARLGVFRPAAQALSLAADLLGAEVAPGLRAEIDRDRAVRTLHRVASRELLAGDGAVELTDRRIGRWRIRRAQFLLAPGLGHVWAQFRLMIASPPNDVALLRLPRRLSFLYGPLRPFLWLWRGLVRRLRSRSSALGR